MLKKETVEELKRILREDYGQDLSMREATEAANALVGCFDLLAKISYRDQRSNKKLKTIKDKNLHDNKLS